MGSSGHSRGGRPVEAVLPGRHPIQVASAADFEIRISGGEHGADVIRQGQKRAHRNLSQTTCSRHHIFGRQRSGNGGAGDCPLPSVRQPDDDQPRPTSRASFADRKAAAIQRMMRVNDLDLRDSPVNRCGIYKCPAIQSSQLRCSTGCCTMPWWCTSKAPAIGCVNTPICWRSHGAPASPPPKRRHAAAVGRPRRRRTPGELRSPYNSVT
jgi:hypothetical protein